MRVAGSPLIRRLVPLTIAVAFTGVLISFVAYTHQLAEELRRDASAFSRIYLSAVRAAASPDGVMETAGVFDLLNELYALEVPFVQTDQDGVPILVRNLPFEADLDDPEDVQRVVEYVEVLDESRTPMVDTGMDMVIHYGDPLFLRRLRWIPWLQTALLFGVVAVWVWTLRTAHRSERERMWSAMTRESAHQMGTPLSSLIGWLEYCDAVLPPDSVRRDGVDILAEMGADVRRLQKVSRRFELIGHSPALQPVNVNQILERLGQYFSVRLPTLGSRVQLELDLPRDAPDVIGNATLLEWAFENLIKNSLDSLAGTKGLIRVEYLGHSGDRAAFRVSDDGPGVPLTVRDRLFEVGVTTKDGGWGVGLSLTRRIIMDVHGGLITLENTSSGASFRVELPLNRVAT